VALHAVVHDRGGARRAREIRRRALAHGLGREHGVDLREIAPVDELHRDEVPAQILAHRVHLDDVRVLEPSDRQRLALEAIDVPALHRETGAQDLERDAPPELLLLRDVDDRHPAASELAFDLEPAEHGARTEHARRAGRGCDARVDHLEAARQRGAVFRGHLLEQVGGVRRLSMGEVVGVLGHEPVEEVVQFGSIAGGVGHDRSERRVPADSSRESGGTARSP
jgi:hypothetical protein